MKKFLLFFLLKLFPFSSIACDCIEIVGFEKAHTVFSGKVIRIKKIENSKVYYIVTFKIIKKYKGIEFKKRYSVIVDCLNEGCCGFNWHT